jgi:hypothetical protein
LSRTARHHFSPRFIKYKYPLATAPLYTPIFPLSLLHHPHSAGLQPPTSEAQPAYDPTLGNIASRHQPTPVRPIPSPRGEHYLAWRNLIGPPEAEEDSSEDALIRRWGSSRRCLELDRGLCSLVSRRFRRDWTLPSAPWNVPVSFPTTIPEGEPAPHTHAIVSQQCRPHALSTGRTPSCESVRSSIPFCRSSQNFLVAPCDSHADDGRARAIGVVQSFRVTGISLRVSAETACRQCCPWPSLVCRIISPPTTHTLPKFTPTSYVLIHQIR